MSIATSIQTVTLDGFDDPRVPSEVWDELVGATEVPVVFLTNGYQRAWWESFSPGELLLMSAQRDGRPVAIAPLFVSGGMGFFVGSGGSDHLDFIGDVADPEVLDDLLLTAREQIEDFVGFRFHHVLDDSPTGGLLSAAATRLGLRIFDEGGLGAPILEVGPGGDEARSAANKKSLRRHENRLAREGTLSVRHLSDRSEIRASLPAFFEQHVTRWSATEHPSLFLDALQRSFYERLVDLGSEHGWLRFTVVEWNGAPIAFHFGFSFRGRYLWYKPSFDVSESKWSPGEVLLRHLLLAAIEEGVSIFDFGIGEESFKARFSNKTARVRTWGLYPPEVVEGASK